MNKEDNVLLIFPSRFSIAPMAFGDLIQCPNVYTTTADYRTLSPPPYIYWLRRIHLSRKINGLCKLPFRYLWYDYATKMGKSLEFKTIIIFGGALVNIDDSVLRVFKNKFPFCRIYVFFWDSINERFQSFYDKARRLKLVDGLLTFDPIDAKKFDMIYTGLRYYSKYSLPQKPIIADVYFIARTWGRAELINACYRKLSANALCTFKMVLDDFSFVEEGIQKLEKPISYMQMLQEMQYHNCILEIVKEGQSGPTLRYFEAVCYNKKLLTNNPEIVNFPFYDERYMKFFQTADDMDVEWVARREPVDYHYDGSFSPVHLIELMGKVSHVDN